MGQGNVDKLFDARKLNVEETVAAEKIRVAFNTLLVKLNSLCPQGREFSLVRTHLEIAGMYAVKSVALKSDTDAKTARES